MTKFFLFDVDGVTIAPREKYFSERFSEDYGVPENLITPLFKNEFQQCLTGKADLREVLRDYVSRWGWEGSIDELLKYWWAGESQLNISVLGMIGELRRKGRKCYLATDQEKNRADYLMREVGLGTYFDGAFFSCNLGVRKHEPEYWSKVLQALGSPHPAEVQFWDDEEENVTVARGVGIQANLFTDIESLKRALESAD